MEADQDVIKGAAPRQEGETWHDTAGEVTGRNKTVLCLCSNELRLPSKLGPFTSTREVTGPWRPVLPGQRTPDEG